MRNRKEDISGFKALAEYLFFPAEGNEGDKRLYVVIIPGGGFNRQWGFRQKLKADRKK